MIQTIIVGLVFLVFCLGVWCWLDKCPRCKSRKFRYVKKWDKYVCNACGYEWQKENKKIKREVL